MLFAPNLIWTKNKPKDYEEHVHKENKVLLIFERLGQVIVTPVALIFSDFNYKGWNFWLPVLGLSFLCMALYELFWLRYFKSEKTMKDFYRSLCGIPVAGATLPVIACRGTSASMTSETFADWENEHVKMLEEYPEKFLIKHYISIAWLKKR